MTKTLRTLYICYYPLTEPLVQTQVIAYLHGLAQHGHCIHLLTFETSAFSPSEKRQWRQRLKEQGITWYSLRYHKRPSLPATAFDVLCGVVTGLRIIRRHRLDTVHARAHVPAAMCLALNKLTGCHFIFDIRGLMAEEYEDAGVWKRDSLPFRLTKSLEHQSIRNADGVVVLTERVRRMLFPDDESKHEQMVKVIPCCADLNRIEAQQSRRKEIRQELSVERKIVMVYAGKFGGYYLQREMVDFFTAAQKHLPNLHFLALTQSDPRLVLNEFEQRGVVETDYNVMRVEPEQIGSYLAAADFGISFREATPSQIAASPTKIGEYLAAGLPVVCNAGIGDVDNIISGNRVGVLVENEFSAHVYQEAIQQLISLLHDEDVQRRCCQVAHDQFSLGKIGVPRYQQLYQSVAAHQA